ncbi:MAG: hypothetical protein EOM47_01255 [Bacteroidia bacterium]|nr:hypothetical protein [Bacteroidia bacterium]
MITNRYMHPTVELCRKCDGEGSLIKFPVWDVLCQTEPTIETCDLCEGSGRVKVSKKIEVTVEPFKVK